MAITKYPWLPPGTTTEQAQAEAMRIMHARVSPFWWPAQHHRPGRGFIYRRATKVPSP